MITLSQNIILHENELHFDFIHASGPGGQNVNKVATAVQLRFNVDTTESLNEKVKCRLREQCKNRINEHGFLIIDARKFRTQKRNLQDAVDRLTMFIKKAEKEPKIRKKTAATKASKEKRLRKKHSRSGIKDLRKSVDPFSDGS